MGRTRYAGITSCQADHKGNAPYTSELQPRFMK